MIEYENMPYHDAANYFGGCYAFEWDAPARRVMPWRMCFDVDMWDGYAHECEVYLTRGRDERITVTGDDLWIGDRFITHRFQVEYVPVGSHVYRVTLEGRDRSRVKGMYGGNIQYYGLLDVDSARTRIVNTADYPSELELMKGIAKVLELGTAPVMRRRVPQDIAEQRARTEVATFMRSARRVLVPEFSWAIIKHRTYPHWAYVLRSGRHVGYVKRDRTNDTVRFCGIRSTVNDRATRSMINTELMDSARRLISTTGNWVDGNPIGDNDELG